MKVRIVNSGQPGHLTKVTDAETGNHLNLHISEISIKVYDDLPHAILTCLLPDIDVIADAEIKYVCPHCGKENE